jgi:hypothetical protein
MKKHLITLAAFAFAGVLKAQTVVPQVVSSSGGSGQNAQGSLAWTIGEPVTATVSDGTSTLTQGFQQPTLLIATALNEKNEAIGILVYPNPTADFVTLKIDQTTESQYNFKIFDTTGKLVNEGKATSTNPNISFSGLASGQYTLSLLSPNSKTQNISIIKQN